MVTIISFNLIKFSLTTFAESSHWGWVVIGVCLFICTISQKLLQVASPNLTQNCSTMSPGNPFVLESRGTKSADVGFCTLVSAGFF